MTTESNATQGTQPTNQWVSTYATWIKAHEITLIILLAAFLLFKTGQGIDNAWIRHEDHIAAAAQSKIDNDTASNKTLADQVAEVRKEADANTATLNRKIADAAVTLKQQQAKDAAASQAEIAARWAQLLPLRPGAVTPSGGADMITPEAANATVQALEQIPVLKDQVIALNQEIIVDLNVVTTQDKLIAALNGQIVDWKAKDKADVDAEKSKNKRSWLKGFKWGVITGAIGVEALRIAVGHP